STTRTSLAAATVAASSTSTSTDSGSTPVTSSSSLPRCTTRPSVTNGSSPPATIITRDRSPSPYGTCDGCSSTATTPIPSVTSGAGCTSSPAISDPEARNTRAYCPTTEPMSPAATTGTVGSTSASTIRRSAAV